MWPQQWKLLKLKQLQPDKLTKTKTEMQVWEHK